MIVGLFLVNFCFSQDNSTYSKIMDSLFISVRNLVVDDIVKTEIKTLSKGDSIDVHSSLAIIFDQKHSFVLYSDCEDDTSFFKLNWKKQKEITDMIINYKAYIEEKKQVPIDMFEYFEFSCSIFYNDVQIKAKYKIKPKTDELDIIDKKIEILPASYRICLTNK